MKMLRMEMDTTRSHIAAGSSSSVPIPSGYNRLPLNPGCHQTTVEGTVKAEPVVNTSDWRTCLPPDSRKKNANKIKGTLKKHVPKCGKEGTKELFEELIFNTATDQVSSFYFEILVEQWNEIRAAKNLLNFGGLSSKDILQDADY